MEEVDVGGEMNAKLGVVSSRMRAMVVDVWDYLLMLTMLVE